MHGNTWCSRIAIVRASQFIEIERWTYTDGSSSSGYNDAIQLDWLLMLVADHRDNKGAFHDIALFIVYRPTRQTIV